MTAGPTHLFVIGAQKAGTTWLHDQFARHEDICVSATKELHYWDVQDALRHNDWGHAELRVARLARAAQHALDGKNRSRKALRRFQAEARALTDLLELYIHTGNDHQLYRDYLDRAYKGQSVIADVTPAYATLDREGFARMRAFAPHSRFIFVMRDPVDRLWSAMKMARQKNGATEESFAREVRVAFDKFCQPEKIASSTRSQYAHTLTELEAAVPVTDIRYFFFEELFRQETMDVVTGWLGLTPVDVQQATVSNEGWKLHMDDKLLDQGLLALEDTYRFVAARFGDALPARWKERIRRLDALKAGPGKAVARKRHRPQPVAVDVSGLPWLARRKSGGGAA